MPEERRINPTELRSLTSALKECEEWELDEKVKDPDWVYIGKSGDWRIWVGKLKGVYGGGALNTALHVMTELPASIAKIYAEKARPKN